MLNNSFQPSDELRTVRTLWRHRTGLVAQAASTVQRMQKALIEMNIQLTNVLSDLSGLSGMTIVQAILGKAFKSVPTSTITVCAICTSMPSIRLQSTPVSR